MLLFIAAVAVQPTVSIRNLQATGIFSTSAQVTLKRTILEDGSVEWSEKSLWNKTTTWLDVRRYSKTGEILTWTFDWKDNLGKGKTQDSYWAFSIEKDHLRVTQVMYRGSKTGQSLVTKKSPAEYNNPSALWWAGITPREGDVANTLLFVPSWDVAALNALAITYEADETLTVNGTAMKTHRVGLKSDMRNETWWLDNEGMPVKRIFWEKDPANPHRVDVMVK